MKVEFTHKDILSIFPWLKARTLISWSERGLVEPEIADASGRGSSRIYSYRNLIEIAFIYELLSRNVPFVQIQRITNLPDYQKTVKTESWETVYWSTRQLVSADVPADKEPPWAGGEGFTPLKEFAQNAEKFLFNPGKHHYAALFTSALIINFVSLKSFVHSQVERV